MDGRRQLLLLLLRGGARQPPPTFQPNNTEDNDTTTTSQQPPPTTTTPILQQRPVPPNEVTTTSKTTITKNNNENVRTVNHISSVVSKDPTRMILRTDHSSTTQDPTTRSAFLKNAARTMTTTTTTRDPVVVDTTTKSLHDDDDTPTRVPDGGVRPWWPPVVDGIVRWFVVGCSTTTAAGAAHDRILSVPLLYLYALLGSSIGFVIYLYFISVGHALGIFLPVVMTLIRYLHRVQQLSLSVSFPSLLHAVLVLAWSLRLGAFLLWREYVSWWPALHHKIRQVQVPLLQKFMTWLVYSLYYVCLASPCYFRLQSNIILQEHRLLQHPTSTFGFRILRTIRSFMTYFGILVQVVGLSLETIADYQKNTFKSQQRRLMKSSSKSRPWCHVGVWQYSTHPNYVGEWLFWCGTMFAALPSTFIHAAPAQGTIGILTNAFITVMKCSIMMVGLYILSIILYGAAHKLDIRQRNKYGQVSTTTEPDDLTFVQYQSTIGMFGPKRWYNRTYAFLHHPRDPTNTDRTATNQALLQQKQQQEEPIQSTEALLDSTLAATEEEMFR